MKKQLSIKDDGRKVPTLLKVGASGKSAVERVMAVLFLICGFTAVASVILITLFMILNGGPAIFKIGVIDFLLGTQWVPNSGNYGILPMILASLLAMLVSVLLAAPIGVSIALFLSKIAPKGVSGIVRSAIELLAGIPSVVYGLLGAMIVVPLVFGLQELNNLPTSGCLLSAVIVLVIMTLPTIISVSENAISAVPKSYLEASLGLGSSKMQSYIKILIPAAKSGIAAALVLGTGRAIGETMAVMMVAGNAALLPEFLRPVKLLTVGISMDWGYSTGLHREALYGIGLVLFIFIMLINYILNSLLKKEGI